MRAACALAPTLTLGLALIACGGVGPAEPQDAGGGRMDGGGDPTDAGSSGAPTYYGDVRPILAANCVMCHQEGGIGPFLLDSYDAVTEVGSRVRDATRDRIMPPFLAEDSDECNHWANYRGLTQEEIDLIGAWFDGGMLEGDPTTPAPAPAELPTLDRVDLTLEIPEYGLNTAVDDDYRCFVVPGSPVERYVTGYEVLPGNVSRVHHVIVYNPVSESAAAEARAREAASPGAGYPCFGASGVSAAPAVVWAPGGGATEYPTGTGIRLAAGRDQIIQVHYNLLSGTGETDRTRVALRLAESAIPAELVLMADFRLNIPPRTESHEETTTVSLAGLFSGVPAGIDELHVYGAVPHMHTLGVSLNVTQNTPSGDRCLIQVPRWDFNWQLLYLMQEPMAVTAADSITITCSYNSMSRDTSTSWGDGTLDEMCLAYLYVSL